MAAEPGWYPDPQGPGRRWWDGRAWTEYVDDVLGPDFVQLAPQSPVVERAQRDERSSAAPETYAYAASKYAPAAYPAVGYGAPAFAPPVGVWRSPVDDRPSVRDLADAVRVVLAKYARFDGRAGRSEFWYWQLATLLASVAVVLAMLVPFLGILIAFVFVAAAVAVIVPTYAVAVRRLRDAGLHWAWIFLSLAPFGTVALIVMWCQPSKYP